MEERCSAVSVWCVCGDHTVLQPITVFLFSESLFLLAFPTPPISVLRYALAVSISYLFYCLSPSPSPSPSLSHITQTALRLFDYCSVHFVFCALSSRFLLSYSYSRQLTCVVCSWNRKKERNVKRVQFVCLCVCCFCSIPVRFQQRSALSSFCFAAPSLISRCSGSQFHEKQPGERSHTACVVVFGVLRWKKHSPEEVALTKRKT